MSAVRAAQALSVDGALLTDLYQLTMAQGYWHEGIHERRANFQLTLRRAPFGGGFAVFCGLGSLLDAIDRYRFETSELQALAALRTASGAPFFEPGFLDHLAGLELGVEIWAPDEGEVLFSGAPILRVEGSLLEGQLLETLVLNLIGYETLVATRSARICHLAASGQPVLDFGLRRAHGPDGAVRMSRAAWVGGVSATSNVLAGVRYGIPVAGTHAHSWVLSFDTEVEAFRAFARSQPENCTLLLDTYDTVAAVERVIELAQDPSIGPGGIHAVRLDSGDLIHLSREVRRRLDAAQLDHVRIVASNDLDEHEIARLRQGGARIDAWGVGTALATCREDPVFSGAYKLTAVLEASGQWRGVHKISEDRFKRSRPGRLQVIRSHGGDDLLLPDRIQDLDGPSDVLPGEPLLVRHWPPEPGSDAVRRLDRDGLERARRRVAERVRELPEALQSLDGQPSQGG